MRVFFEITGGIIRGSNANLKAEPKPFKSV